MSGELVIKALCEADATVVSLVSTRMYSETRPEGDPLPALVWIEVSDIPHSPIAAAASDEPMRARIQVNCLATTSAGAKTLRDAVVSACHLKYGSIGGVQVNRCVQDVSASSGYDREVGAYQRSVDFLIDYQR